MPNLTFRCQFVVPRRIRRHTSAFAPQYLRDSRGRPLGGDSINLPTDQLFSAPKSHDFKAPWPGNDGNFETATYHLLFWALHGATFPSGESTATPGEDGGETENDFTAPDIVNIAGGPVKLTAWYGTYGWGPGTNGVMLDEWDDAAFDWLNDVPFVSVDPGELDPPSPQAPGVSIANDSGDLLTDWSDASIGECLVTAVDAVPSASGPFRAWKVTQVPKVDHGRVAPGLDPHVLEVERGAQAFAIAHYKARPPSTEDIDEGNARRFGTVINSDGTISVIVLMPVHDARGRLILPKGTVFRVTPPGPPRPNWLAPDLRSRLAGFAIRDLLPFVDDLRIRRALEGLGSELMVRAPHKKVSPKPTSPAKETRPRARGQAAARKARKPS